MGKATNKKRAQKCVSEKEKVFFIMGNRSKEKLVIRNALSR